VIAARIAVRPQSDEHHRATTFTHDCGWTESHGAIAALLVQFDHGRCVVACRLHEPGADILAVARREPHDFDLFQQSGRYEFLMTL